MRNLFRPRWSCLLLACLLWANATQAELGETSLLPDLHLETITPHGANQGVDRLVEVRVFNAANSPTVGAGAEVLVVLSQDPAFPETHGLPAVPGVFVDGAPVGPLVAVAHEMLPSSKGKVEVSIQIPFEAPVGSYHLCVKADPYDKISERDESNNAVCKPLEIAAAQTSEKVWQPTFWDFAFDHWACQNEKVPSLGVVLARIGETLRCHCYYRLNITAKTDSTSQASLQYWSQVQMQRRVGIVAVQPPGGAPTVEDDLPVPEMTTHQAMHDWEPATAPLEYRRVSWSWTPTAADVSTSESQRYPLQCGLDPHDQVDEESEDNNADQGPWIVVYDSIPADSYQVEITKPSQGQLLPPGSMLAYSVEASSFFEPNRIELIVERKIDDTPAGLKGTAAHPQISWAP